MSTQNPLDAIYSKQPAAPVTAASTQTDASEANPLDAIYTKQPATQPTAPQTSVQAESNPLDAIYTKQPTAPITSSATSGQGESNPLDAIYGTRQAPAQQPSQSASKTDDTVFSQASSRVSAISPTRILSTNKTRQSTKVRALSILRRIW